MALAAGACGWAAGRVLAPAPAAASQAGFTTIAVVDGEVGASIRLNAAAQWTLQPAGTNRVAGIVTAVSLDPSKPVANGAVVYRVGQRPVTVAHGTVPAFRDLGLGAQGDDVAELQQMLADRGLLHATADGRFAAATAEAVRAWQRSLGLSPTGVVMLGDVVFVPQDLPGRLSLDATLVHTDATLAGGEAALLGLPASPDFTMTVSPDQAASIADGVEVHLTGVGAVTWTARVSGRHAGENDSVVLGLTGAGGAAVCGGDCDAVPVGVQTQLAAQVITVATVKGLVVPVAALRSPGAGGTEVVDAAGARHAVQVEASANGLAVITGVQAGERVRVPAGAAP